MITKTTIPELSKRDLSIDDVLRHGTSNIEVLTVLSAGERYARHILSQLGDRGALFAIDPHNMGFQNVVFPLAPKGFVYVDDPDSYKPLEFDWEYFGFDREEIARLKAKEPKPIKTPLDLMVLNPRNTLVICDDVIEGKKHTFRRVRNHLSSEFGYRFDADKPPHFLCSVW